MSGRATTLVVLVIGRSCLLTAWAVAPRWRRILGLRQSRVRFGAGLVGRTPLDLSPIIVFLALWCGGWFWASRGIVLAVPSLVALKGCPPSTAKHGTPLLAFLSRRLRGSAFHRLADERGSVLRVLRRLYNHPERCDRWSSAHWRTRIRSAIRRPLKMNRPMRLPCRLR